MNHLFPSAVNSLKLIIQTPNIPPIPSLYTCCHIMPDLYPWQGPNVGCLQKSRCSHGPDPTAATTSPEIINAFLSHRLRVSFFCSPAKSMWTSGLGCPGSLWLGLYHCVRNICSLYTVVKFNIFRLHSAYEKSELCLWPTASESVWDSWQSVRTSVDQSLWTLPWILIVPDEIGVPIIM